EIIIMFALCQYKIYYFLLLLDKFPLFYSWVTFSLNNSGVKISQNYNNFLNLILTNKTAAVILLNEQWFIKNLFKGYKLPGFDGTGPTGQGPFTGGGRGFCAMPVGLAGGNLRDFNIYGTNSGSINYPGLFANRRYAIPYYPYYSNMASSFGYSGRPGGYYRTKGQKGIKGRGRRY
ncbi:MAG: DUF5320 domain-containing protein, partial [Actinobacteria bacterium]|nr:DUF5320 domain-containing protein [Actinomycetota bacterium]